MQVEVAECRQERIRIANCDRFAIRVADSQSVWRNVRMSFYKNFEEPGRVPHQHSPRRLVVEHQLYLRCRRMKGANDHSANSRMSTENRVRIVMSQREESVDLLALPV